MKRIMIMMMVIGSFAFGRDFEVREWQEQKLIHEPVQVEQEMLSRERDLSESNLIEYSDFHRELDNMNRGTEDK